MSVPPVAVPTKAPSRRTVVRSAVWSVPAVSVAAAAPAFASSPGRPALAFSVVDVRPVLGWDATGWFFDLDFRNLVIAAGAGGQPQSVRLTFQFKATGGPRFGTAPEQDYLMQSGVPSGWVSSHLGVVAELTFTWSSAAQVSFGSPLVISSAGVLMGCNMYEVEGVFTLTASATNYQDAVTTIATGPGPATAGPAGEAAASGTRAQTGTVMGRATREGGATG